MSCSLAFSSVFGVLMGRAQWWSNGCGGTNLLGEWTLVANECFVRPRDSIDYNSYLIHCSGTDDISFEQFFVDRCEGTRFRAEKAYDAPANECVTMYNAANDVVVRTHDNAATPTRCSAPSSIRLMHAAICCAFRLCRVCL